MIASAVTIPGMSKKKSAGNNRPPKAAKREMLFRMEAALADALSKYMAAQRPRPSMNEVLKTDLEDYLEGEGFWPPASTPSVP